MNFRQRLEQGRMSIAGETAQPPSPAAPPEPEEYFSTPYFATDRSSNSSCLELRLQDGSRKAFPYSYFTGLHFEADAGIEIVTTQNRILIRGRNLIALYEYLVAYRVRYVQADMGQDAQEDGVFVANITIEGL